MINKKLLLTNHHGLHARAADKFVKCAMQCSCDVTVRYKDRTANGKSILGVMTLGAGKGSEIELILDGSDEIAALATLENLIANRFNEPE